MLSQGRGLPKYRSVRSKWPPKDAMLTAKRQPIYIDWTYFGLSLRQTKPMAGAYKGVKCPTEYRDKTIP